MRHRAATGVLVALVAVAALTGCDEGRQAIGEEDLGDAPLPTVDVEIDEDGFDPDELIVAAGDAVEFHNVGDEEHGIRSGEVIDSGLLRPGESTVVVLDTPRTLEVEDIADPGHAMTITVEPQVPD